MQLLSLPSFLAPIEVVLLSIIDGTVHFSCPFCLEE